MKKKKMIAIFITMECIYIYIAAINWVCIVAKKL